METPTTLLEAIRIYSDPDVCRETLAALRWPDGVTCPHCGSQVVGFLATRKIWKCKAKECRKQFSVKVGTIFEDSPLGLDKWLPAVWLIANAKNGISSWEISRSLGVTQKTAWFMMHRIRLVMKTESFSKLSGKVEADETLVGGSLRFMHPGKKAQARGRTHMGKAIVMGILERNGKARTKVVADQTRETLQAEVKGKVEPGSNIFTDELASYDGLEKEYIHEVINHAEAYVKGHIHTNGMENYWSLFKRCLKGTYICVEPFHLSRYLDEQEFRFNNRKTNDTMRFLMAASEVAGKRIKYQELIGKSETV